MKHQLDKILAGIKKFESDSDRLKHLESDVWARIVVRKAESNRRMKTNNAATKSTVHIPDFVLLKAFIPLPQFLPYPQIHNRNLSRHD